MRTKLLLVMLCVLLALASSDCSAATAPRDFPTTVLIAQGDSLIYRSGTTNRIWSGGDRVVLNWTESTGIFTVDGLPYKAGEVEPEFSLQDLKRMYGAIPVVVSQADAHKDTDELTRWRAAVAFWQTSKNELIRRVETSFEHPADDRMSTTARFEAAIATLSANPLVESANLDPREGSKRLIHIRWAGGRKSSIELPAEKSAPEVAHPLSLEEARSLAHVLGRLEQPGWKISLLDGNLVVEGNLKVDSPK